MSIRIFETRDELAESIASDLLALSLNDDRMHIALSGGSTPKHIFDYIAQSHFATRIKWANLHFWWGDERCVSPADPESNYGEAMRLLFSKILIPLDNLHPIHGELTPEKAAIEFKDEMASCLPTRFFENATRPIYDWVLLGIGEDGHTASLFPGHADFTERESAVVASHPDTKQMRISLSAGTIRAARRVSYLAVGESKAQVLEEILTNEMCTLDYPAARIRSESGITEWYLDKKSAFKISHLSEPKS